MCTKPFTVHVDVCFDRLVKSRVAFQSPEPRIIWSELSYSKPNIKDIHHAAFVLRMWKPQLLWVLSKVRLSGIGCFIHALPSIGFRHFNCFLNLQHRETATRHDHWEITLVFRFTAPASPTVSSALPGNMGSHRCLHRKRERPPRHTDQPECPSQSFTSH